MFSIHCRNQTKQYIFCVNAWFALFFAYMSHYVLRGSSSFFTYLCTFIPNKYLSKAIFYTTFIKPIYLFFIFHSRFFVCILLKFLKIQNFQEYAYIQELYNAYFPFIFVLPFWINTLFFTVLCSYFPLIPFYFLSKI